MNYENLDDLVEAIYEMPDSAAKIPLMEEAIRLADQQNDTQLALDLRLELTTVAVFYGQQLKALGAFSWCLAMTDREDTSLDFDVDDILWKYKWICSNASDFYEVGLEKVKELVEDYKARLLKNGFGLYSYHYMRMNTGIALCDHAMADAGYEETLKTRRDYMADCKACVDDGMVDYLLFKGDYAGALKKAAPILSGRSWCAEVPHYTYGRLLLPAFFAGDTENAREFNKKGFRLISRNSEFMGIMGNYITYYAFTDMPKALRTYQRHVHWSFDKYSLPSSRFDFSKGSMVFFDKLKKSGKDSLKVILPSQHPIYREEGIYATGDLFTYHYEIAKDLADNFDRRNQNSGYNDDLKRVLEYSERY